MTPLERSYDTSLTYVFRPDEQKYGPEYREKVRRLLEIDSMPDDLKHPEIECCEFVGRIESNAVYDYNLIDDSFEGQSKNIAVFAIH
jgi:hypothetical protein